MSARCCRFALLLSCSFVQPEVVTGHGSGYIGLWNLADGTPFSVRFCRFLSRFPLFLRSFHRLMSLQSAWPLTVSGNTQEFRALAVADLNGDGTIGVFVWIYVCTQLPV